MIRSAFTATLFFSPMLFAQNAGEIVCWEITLLGNVMRQSGSSLVSLEDGTTRGAT